MMPAGYDPAYVKSLLNNLGKQGRNIVFIHPNANALMIFMVTPLEQRGDTMCAGGSIGIEDMCPFIVAICRWERGIAFQMRVSLPYFF